MATNRIYVPFMLFGVRIVNMQHLWTPSDDYQGKKQEKPSWFLTCVTAKTRGSWWEEPLLAPAWTAYSELLTKAGMTPQHISEWPIRDGDMSPEPGKAPAEWARGHWVFGGSSTNSIKVEIFQGGNVVPLPQKINVKPGDFVSLGLSAAIKQNNPRALKHFCNTVLFTGPGEEIAVGNSVSGAELMRSAEMQGFRPTGFSASPGGFGGPSGGGFAPPSQQAPGGFTPPQGPQPGQYGGTPNGPAYAPPQGPQPGFTGPGSAPTPGGPAFAGAPVPNGAPAAPGAGTAFPSSGPAWPQR